MTWALNRSFASSNDVGPIGFDSDTERTDCARHVSTIASSFTRYFCCNDVDLVKICFEAVLLEFVCGGAEGVGFDDVGASA